MRKIFNRQLFTRVIRLMWGLILYALGVAVTLNAQIGYAPWEVFHVGLSKTIGVSIGAASIMVGVIIIIATTLLGEKLGIGTILNMILIGVFLDIILILEIIPLASNFLFGVIMLTIGLLIIALGSYFYIGSAFGTGPRDSLMVALTRKTKLPIGLCRGLTEFLAVLSGWKLGGMVGAGTIISVFLIGFFVQMVFKIFKFDATKIQHETLGQTYKIHFRNKKEQLHVEKISEDQ